jgi:RNase P subunit RPR2
MSANVKSESKCPVCDYKLEAGAKSVRLEGRNVTVCCDECAEKVRANPAKYLSKR